MNENDLNDLYGLELWQREITFHDVHTALAVSFGVILALLGGAALVSGWPALGIVGVIAGVGITGDRVTRPIGKARF